LTLARTLVCLECQKVYDRGRFVHFVTWLALCSKARRNYVERLPHEVFILLDWVCAASAFCWITVR